MTSNKKRATLKEKKRCKWVPVSDAEYTRYHDVEWGVAVHDDRLLFEMLNLEGAQAGLSWLTILRRREGYRKAFLNFEAKKLIKFTAAKQASLMNNEGIIRNRLKIQAVTENAKAYLLVQKNFTTFDAYIWQFTDNKILVRPSKKRGASISEAMSRDLKKRGFRFVGPTICYAFMQAIGMVDDHDRQCFKGQ
jgi:DNA-3-methyladenine glycosylase I